VRNSNGFLEGWTRRATCLRHRAIFLALVFGTMILAVTPALATTATAALTVSATVVSSCRASSPATAASATQAVTTLNAGTGVAVNCTGPTAYNLATHPAVASPASTTVTGGESSLPLTVTGEALPAGTHPDTVVVSISY